MVQGKARTVLFIIIIAFVAVIGFYGTREPQVTVKGSELKISGFYGTTADIGKISEIKEITQGSIPVGTKINGFNFGNTLKGRFNYGDNSSAKVFLESQSAPYIVITLNDDIIVINFKNSSKTNEVYSYLKDMIKK